MTDAGIFPVSLCSQRNGSRASNLSGFAAAVARAQANYDLGALDWARIGASSTPDETLARARAAMKS
jgi:hypothetical protein